MSWKELLEEKSALATAIDLVGDRWSLMILAGCIANVNRFNQIEDQLGINRNLLSSRLDRLIETGLIDKRQYNSKPPRFEYKLTKIGLELRPIIAALTIWGERHFTKESTPISIVHKKCGSKIDMELKCSSCKIPLRHLDVTSVLNPNAGPASTRVFNEKQALFRGLSSKI